MDIKNNNFISIEQVTNQYLNKNKPNKSGNENGVSFQDIFLEQTHKTAEVKELKFSKHAGARLESREIEMTSEQLDRLKAGAQKAGEKGISESLVLVDNMAFIVNVDNNTVVTAMDSAKAQEKVFTNIDGAVII
ncbi:MAG: flagellar protein [Lachnospiraceae bacterium]|nr:flagellar protein [Lachnospiraceae bacterium]MCR5082477.1 flagellar protein [Parasporobacterium sp.]